MQIIYISKFFFLKFTYQQNHNLKKKIRYHIQVTYIFNLAYSKNQINMENNSITTSENFETNLTENSKLFLREAGKWATFLSILGFIGIGIMIVFSLFAGTIFAVIPNSNIIQGVSSVIITVFYLALSALYFFPILYLYNFGKNIKLSFKENNITALENAFKNLKSHYKFIGILTIIFMVLYFIVLIPSIIISAIL